MINWEATDKAALEKIMKDPRLDDLIGEVSLSEEALAVIRVEDLHQIHDFGEEDWPIIEQLSAMYRGLA